MKKVGDLLKSFFVHGLFIGLVIIAILLIVGKGHVTGDAVLDEATAQQKFESALASASMFSQVMQANICVVVNDPEGSISFSAQKSQSGWTVTPTTGFCSGLSSEDLVIQFASFDAFSKMVDSPSPKNLANGAKNREYEILKSKFVELGGNVICDATFKVKFCPALKQMASPSELIDGDMVCCLDSLTKEQRAQLESHLQQGNFEDEIGIIQEKAGGAGLFGLSMTVIGGAGGALLLVVIILVVLMTKGKSKPKASDAPKGKVSGVMPGAMPGQIGPVTASAPATLGAAITRGSGEDPAVTELRKYISGILVQGYAPDDVRGHLLQIGWDMETADKVLLEEYNKLSDKMQAG